MGNRVSLKFSPRLPPGAFFVLRNPPIAAQLPNTLARSFLTVASRSLIPCKGARRATAQEVHVAALLNWAGRKAVREPAGSPAARFLDGGLRLADSRLAARAAPSTSSPTRPCPAPHHEHRTNPIRHFPFSPCMPSTAKPSVTRRCRTGSTRADRRIVLKRPPMASISAADNVHLRHGPTRTWTTTNSVLLRFVPFPALP
jgi:hypothetical protein